MIKKPGTPVKTRVNISDFEKSIREIEDVENQSENVKLLKEKLKNFNKYLNNPDNKEKRLCSSVVQSILTTDLVEPIIKIVRQADETIMELNDKIDKISSDYVENEELKEGK